LFAALLLKERLTRQQVLGMAVALGGIALIALDLGATSPAGAFVMVIGAAAAWGVSNVVMRRAAPPDMLRFMVWVSALAVLPLFALSALFEGPRRDWAALRTVTWPAAGSVLFVGLVATVVGFGVWGYLIRTYSASMIAPFSLLVPVFGMSAAALLTGEQLTPLRILAAMLIIVGVLSGLRRTPAGTGFGAAEPSAVGVARDAAQGQRQQPVGRLSAAGDSLRRPRDRVGQPE
jgi:O-acetylserine/cysteine efflux transporter